MPAILIVLPIVALVLGAALLLGMRVLRRGYTYAWLVAVAGVLIAWGLLLASGSRLPLNLALANWQPRVLLPISPALLLDRIAWPFQLSLVTLCLAVILTNVIRPIRGSRPGGSWGDLVWSLLFSAAAMLATVAGNLLAILLAWSLLDLSETALWLGKVRTRQESESVVIALAIRLVGGGLATWAGLSTYTTGQTLAFSALSPQVNSYLLVAAGIRLGVFPLRPPLPRVGNVPSGLRTLLRLAPAASSLVILVRAASASLPVVQANLLLALAGVAVVFNGLVWMNTASVQESLPYWIAGVSGLALACGLRGQPDAALSWGLVLITFGGMFGLATARPRSIRILLLVAALGFSGLPFTPAWPGVSLYGRPLSLLLALFLIGQSLLLIGTVRQALRPTAALVQGERWVWIIYPFGLLLLSGSAILSSWWAWPGTLGTSARWPTWLGTGLGAVPTLVAGVGFLLFRKRILKRRRQHSPQWLARLRGGLEFAWLYALGWQFYRWLMQVAAFVSRALEGQAGVLWALLFLTLLLSLYVQLSQWGV